MRKTNLLFSVLLVLISTMAFAQKKNKNILKSTDIAEIEEYLKTTHPDDPKRIVLKTKLTTLKNEAWTKGAKTAKPMAARPIVITEVPDNVMRQQLETEEFKKLLSETSNQHKDKTVKLLNAMFNEDVSSKEVILLAKNESECDLILRIQGDKFYNLAVPKKSENFIVIEKGNYTLTSNVCNNVYSSIKEVKKGILITLNTPT